MKHAQYCIVARSCLQVVSHDPFPVLFREPSESKPDDGGENGTVEVVEEEPAPVMTLDEYRAMKEKTRAKVELNHRKVDGKEGWKNAVELKKEETEFFSGTRVSARLIARTHECSKCTI